MKLYAIRNWNEIYENNRSRQIESLSWVPFPNKHDGENFSLIMRHKDGAIIFAAFILLVELASKCKPRGVLIRGNGQPHNVTSMSAKCQAPDVWFSTALDYLEHNTDWLEVKEFTNERQSGVTSTSVGRQSGDEEGKGTEEGKGREGARPFSEIPSWEQFWEYCQSPHCGISAEWFAKDKFLAAEQKGWQGISDWRKYALRVRGWWDNDGRPETPPTKNGQKKKKGWVD